MKIEISIPKEFERDYVENKFQETFDRVMADIYWNMSTDEPSVAGGYEYETLRMLSEAFANSKEIKEENSEFEKKI